MTALPSPSALAETTLSGVLSVTSGVDTLIGVFATDPGIPGVTDYPAGTANRTFWVSTSSCAPTYWLHIQVRTTGGVETLVRDEFSPNFSGMTLQSVNWTATASAGGAVNVTDRLVIKVYATKVTGSGTPTVTVYFQGSAHPSQVQTTISAGAQGPAGPQGTPGKTLVAFTIDGNAAVIAGDKRWYNDTGASLTFGTCRVTATTSPTGADLIIDINKNGTTIFTTQANRPRVTAGGVTGTGTPDVTTLANGDYLTVDVDQVGSTVPGANVTVQITLT
jgi:hypothetical protein